MKKLRVFATSQSPLLIPLLIGNLAKDICKRAKEVKPVAKRVKVDLFTAFGYRKGNSNNSNNSSNNNNSNNSSARAIPIITSNSQSLFKNDNSSSSSSSSSCSLTSIMSRSAKSGTLKKPRLDNTNLESMQQEVNEEEKQKQKQHDNQDNHNVVTDINYDEERETDRDSSFSPISSPSFENNHHESESEKEESSNAADERSSSPFLDSGIGSDILEKEEELDVAPEKVPAEVKPTPQFSFMELRQLEKINSMGESCMEMLASYLCTI